MAEQVPPDDAVLIRFSMRSPYWPMSMSYGLFMDHALRIAFASLDHYLGYRMLADPSDKQRVLKAPNGYLAHMELLNIMRADTFGRSVSPTWERDRNSIMDEGVRLKYSQSSMLRDMLVRTGHRPIFDVSRDDEHHWCHASGVGANAHGKSLMLLRERILRGEDVSTAVA